MIELVAEIGINHSGDIDIAKKLIDVISAAGIQYVKFQKRQIDLVYTEEELNKPRESPWGTTTRQQKEGLEFGYDDYVEIDKYCRSKAVKWFASPWDVSSLFFLGSFDVPFIKIPSALITNMEMLDMCRQTKKPVILSTGMSTLDMVDKAITVLGKDNIYCIMACTSTYPTSPDEINAKCIETLKHTYPWAKIGFSNHYPGLMAMVMATTLGAEMIEFHVTLDRTMYGSDQAASIEPHGVFQLMERIKLIGRMLGNGEKRIYDSEHPIIAKLRK